MNIIELEVQRPKSDKNFPRNIMPQIRKGDIKDSPFTFSKEKIKTSELKPVQNQRVKGMHDRAKRGFDDGTIRPIIVDKNNYIVNGHHRFDIALHQNLEKVNIIKVDSTIEELIDHFSKTVSDEPTYEQKFKQKMDEIFGGGGVPDYKTMPAYKLKKKKVGKHKFFVPSNEPTPKGVSALENFADGKKEAFIRPNFDYEWEEANRYPEFKKLGKDGWVELASKGKATTIVSAKDINNTDAADVDSFKTLDPQKQKRATAQLKSGKVEMPIVAVYSDGYKELVGGNTRLTAMMAKNGKATVWQFDVPDEILDENFADGKVKGKSRPGRVKKAGASCKGSVSSLRAKAKKYSGEKSKMYHWCANMKSGKK